MRYLHAHYGNIHFAWMLLFLCYILAYIFRLFIIKVDGVDAVNGYWEMSNDILT